MKAHRQSPTRRRCPPRSPARWQLGPPSWKPEASQDRADHLRLNDRRDHPTPCRTSGTGEDFGGEHPFDQVRPRQPPLPQREELSAGHLRRSRRGGGRRCTRLAESAIPNHRASPLGAGSQNAVVSGRVSPGCGPARPLGADESRRPRKRTICLAMAPVTRAISSSSGGGSGEKVGVLVSSGSAYTPSMTST